VNRIDATFERLRKEGRKALAMFVTAGIPPGEPGTPGLVVALARAGADIIELGLPFSDPIADGPTIQRSSALALRNGMTMAKTFDIVREIRRTSQVPLVLMGYANPVFSFGLERFLDTARDTGVDGVILADVPYEESGAYRKLAAGRGIHAILLAAPTTPPERLRMLDDASSGFLYCVSVTGVTGERTALAEQAGAFIAAARTSVTRNPLMAGFGIATPDDAARLAERCDGVIVGSALVHMLMEEADPLPRAVAFTQSLRSALG
jgi:tryptophan synthase alpha chain